MKKLILFTALIIYSSVVISQNNKVVSAFNYHKNGKLDKAKENIDPALTNEKTMNKAKTWYYCGNIYLDIARSPDSAVWALDPDALNKSYEAYKKAMELDEKNEYKLDIIQRMPIVGESYFNMGAKKYNAGSTATNANDTVLAQQEYKESMMAFEKAYIIYSESGIIDTTTIYYIAVAAELAEENEIAKEKLAQLIGMNYPEAGIYSSLANIYLNKDNDTLKAAKTFEIGRERYPNDLNLLLTETNLFLATGETEKALNNLQLAADIDKTNPTIFFAIGAKYNEIVDDTTRSDTMRNDAFVKAADAYKKSIEIDSTYFNPSYNMGALYVNKASSIIEVANALPYSEQEKYDQLKLEADEYLSQSLPYLEKAHELEPGDKATMYSLKEIYTRLKMYDQLKEINAKLEE